MPFAQQEQIMKHLLHGLPNLRGAALDARGNGQSIAEAMRDEFGAEVCESVMLSENWYRTHTAPFKAALEDGTLDAIPKDEDILTDLRAFELVRGVPRIPDVRTKGQDGKKRHGDLRQPRAEYRPDTRSQPPNPPKKRINQRLLRYLKSTYHAQTPPQTQNQSRHHDLQTAGFICPSRRFPPVF